MKRVTAVEIFSSLLERCPRASVRDVAETVGRIAEAVDQLNAAQGKPATDLVAARLELAIKQVDLSVQLIGYDLGAEGTTKMLVRLADADAGRPARAPWRTAAGGRG